MTTLAQIVLGAKWQNSLFRGFGITFFALNLFARYHEFFWKPLDLGQNLLAVGGMLLIVGGGTDAVVRKLRQKGGAE